MRLFGRALAALAAFFYQTEWRQIRRDLHARHDRFRKSLALQIPTILVHALIVAEDRRFYAHGGVDPIAVARALWRVTAQGKIEGASTLEQQLVRTVSCRYEKTIARKVREVLLASLVHRAIPKKSLPGLYLSVAYFGWGMNGLEQACERLNIQLEHLSLEQAASLVARIKYPEPRELSLARSRQIRARERHIVRLVRSPEYVLVSPMRWRRLTDGAISGIAGVPDSEGPIPPA